MDDQVLAGSRPSLAQLRKVDLERGPSGAPHKGAALERARGYLPSQRHWVARVAVGMRGARRFVAGKSGF